MDTSDFQTASQVSALIDAAGGPTSLARQMGFDRNTGRQRVANWRMNGRIPEMVVKAYKPFFTRLMKRAVKSVPAE